MLMKRLCLLLMLGLASTMAFGVKSYVYMIQTSSGCSLWGDIPDGMDEFYPSYNTYIGDIINTLGNKGYVLDKFDLEVSAESHSSSNAAYMQNERVQVAIMSRDGESDKVIANVTTSTTSPDSGTEVNAATRASEEGVTEIARYNLLGQKINGAEAGVQIIVYSDYSTKTIINE